MIAIQLDEGHTVDTYSHQEALTTFNTLDCKEIKQILDINGVDEYKQHYVSINLRDIIIETYF